MSWRTAPSAGERRWSSFQPKARVCAHGNERPETCACGFGCPCKGRTCPRAKIKAKAPRRIEEEKVFDVYVKWLHGKGAVCVVCGTSINIQGAHVARSLGMGRKHGRACDMVRLCGARGRKPGCHQQFDERTGSFEGWTDEQREAASTVWRLLHWSGFRDWVGVCIERQVFDQAEAKKLIACEAEIVRAWEQLSGTAIASRVAS